MKIIYLSLVAILFSCNSEVQLKRELIKHELAYYQTTTKAQDWNSSLESSLRLVSLDRKFIPALDSILDSLFKLENYEKVYAYTDLYFADTVSLRSKRITHRLAYAAYNSSKFQDAIILFQELIKLTPENMHKIEYEIGMCFFQLENYSSTLKQMQKVIANPASKVNVKEYITEGKKYSVPYHVAAVNTIGYLYYLSGDFDKALQAYDTVLSEYPYFQLALNNKALIPSKQ